MNFTKREILWVPALVLAMAQTLCAHTQSDAYLNLHTTANGVAGQWHLGLRDLEDAIGLDSNDDGVVTWGELLSRKDAV